VNTSIPADSHPVTLPWTDRLPPDADCAIIGGGFSGLMTLVHLAERMPKARIVLLERRTTRTPGVARIAQEARVEPADGLGTALEHLHEGAVEKDQPPGDFGLAVAQMRGADDAEDRVESGSGRRPADVDDPLQHGSCPVPAVGRRVVVENVRPAAIWTPSREVSVNRHAFPPGSGTIRCGAHVAE